MGWRHMVLSFSDLVPLGRPQGQITPSLMQPNAGPQPRRQPERGTSGGCWRRLQADVRQSMALSQAPVCGFSVWVLPVYLGTASAGVPMSCVDTACGLKTPKNKSGPFLICDTSKFLFAYLLHYMFL